MKKRNVVRSGLLSGTRILGVCMIALVALGGYGIYHYIQSAFAAPPIPVTLDPNIGIKAQVAEFFEANDAPEMLPIIECESRFRHYEADGSVLRNLEGSSAIGVAQILASKHPDPKVLRSYNRTHDTALTVEDFDITTLESNLAYALLLFEVRGTRDWECAKKFRFQS